MCVVAQSELPLYIVKVRAPPGGEGQVHMDGDKKQKASILIDVQGPKLKIDIFRHKLFFVDK